MADSKAETLDLVGSLYDATMDGRQWPSVLQSVAASLNAQGAMLRSIDGVTKRVGFFHALNYDEGYVHAYREHFVHLDPYQRLLSTIPVGEFLSGDEAAGEARRKGEYFNDYERPQDKIFTVGGTLAREGASMIQTGFHRGRRSGDFESEDLRRLDLIRPHLVRAVQMHQSFTGAATSQSLALASLDELRVAILFTDAVARPFHANRAAEHLLSKADGLRVHPDGLAMSDAADTARLRRLIAMAALTTAGEGIAAGGEIFSVKNHRGRALQIRVAPLSRRHLPEELFAPSACAAVFVSQPGAMKLGWRGVAALFGLTPAEAKLAVTVADGKTLEEAAAHSGASIYTVRNQMKSVLAKTRVRRQSELVALLLGSLLAHCRPEDEEGRDL